MIAALSSLSSVPPTPSPAATPSAPHFAFPPSLPSFSLSLSSVPSSLSSRPISASSPYHSPPRSVFSIPTPQSKNLSLAKYNAGILSLSIEYQAMAEYFHNNDLELTQDYIFNFHNSLLKDYDKDHQGGESVFIQSIKANKMMSPSRTKIQPIMASNIQAPYGSALYVSSANAISLQIRILSHHLHRHRVLVWWPF